MDMVSEQLKLAAQVAKDKLSVEGYLCGRSSLVKGNQSCIRTSQEEDHSIHSNLFIFLFALDFFTFSVY
jgi:hypothetical protein